MGWAGLLIFNQIKVINARIMLYSKCWNQCWILKFLLNFELLFSFNFKPKKLWLNFGPPSSYYGALIHIKLQSSIRVICTFFPTVPIVYPLTRAFWLTQTWVCYMVGGEEEKGKVTLQLGLMMYPTSAVRYMTCIWTSWDWGDKICLIFYLAYD